MTEPLAALQAVASVLDRGGFRWCLFGAHAVAIRADPRATKDIDVTVELQDSQLEPLIQALREAGLQPRAADPLEFARRFSVVPVVHVASGMPIDMVIANTRAERDALERATLERYLGVELPVMSAEDLVIFKLSSERERDYRDARAVIAVCAESLDVELVRRGLRERELLFDRSDLVSELDALLKRYRSTK